MTAPQGQCLLLVDDDRLLSEGLALALERNGRTVIVCNDLESAEMALQRFPVTHVVSDVQFTSAFGFEGLHFASRARSSRAPRVILMTGAISDALRAAAPAFGADAILAKPFTIAELESALAASHPQLSDSPAENIRVTPLDEILESGLLRSVFQPIVTLDGRSHTPFGYEALTRSRDPWPLGGPSELFEYASRRSMLGELNRAMARSAFRSATELPGSPALFVNVDPAAFDRHFLDCVTRASAEAGIPLSRVVIEITERSSFPDEGRAGEIFEVLRARGVRFALDDHGSAYSHLAMIRRIAPAFVKISATFGTGFETDSYKQRIVHHVVALARDFGAQAILEGVETEATAAAAYELGVVLAQGYHLGRPHSASCWSAAA